MQSPMCNPSPVSCVATSRKDNKKPNKGSENTARPAGVASTVEATISSESSDENAPIEHWTESFGEFV